VRTEVARQGAEQTSIRREVDRQGQVLESVDSKVDGVLTELATNRGVTVQKTTAKGGAIALVATAAAVSGVIVTLLVAFVK